MVFNVCMCFFAYNVHIIITQCKNNNTHTQRQNSIKHNMNRPLSSSVTMHDIDEDLNDLEIEDTVQLQFKYGFFILVLALALISCLLFCGLSIAVIVDLNHSYQWCHDTSNFNDFPELKYYEQVFFSLVFCFFFYF